MFKKTLISVAVASSLGLTGCFDSADSGANANPDYQINNPDIDGKTWPEFNPVTGELPVPNDLIFDSEQGDGTFGVADTAPPVTTALNELSGASTVAPAVVQFNGMIDTDSVDARAFIIVDGAPVPNPNQNVFLIELDYASGDPLRGLSNSEPPTIPLAITAQMAGSDVPEIAGPAGLELFNLATTPAYKAEVVELDGQSAIRILPNKPLDPQKRYVVVVTNEVKDINGDPISQSPSYANITDEGQPLGTSSLAPVRAIMNGLWETIATSYFALNNSVRVAQGGEALSADNIALSYSFTTSNDEKVLQYIAEPAAWFADQLTASVKVTTAKKTVGAAKFAANPEDESLTVKAGYDFNEDGEITAADFDVNGDTAFDASDFDWTGDGEFDYFDVAEATEFALAAFPLVNAEIDSSGTCPTDSGGEAFINCIAIGAASQLNDALPTPTPVGEFARSANDFSFDGQTPQAVALISAVTAPVIESVAANAGISPAPTVLALQGTVSLPYYLGTSGSDILTNSWQADNALAAGINAVLGVQIPQADPTNSTAVNYIFPFPKKQADVDVPVLFIYPQSTTTRGVVMFQHGIGTDRSAALTFGTALATLGYTVVAIDHPLHGIAAFTAEEQVGLGVRLLEGAGLDTATAESLAPALAEGKAAFDAALAGTPLDGLFDEPTRLSLVNTVANAGSTIPGLPPLEGERHFGVYAPAPGQISAIDYEAGIGDSGSLFLNLQNFLNTRDNFRQSVVDQMNLRVSLSNLDLSGAGGANLTGAPVNFVGHSLGTITGAPFVASMNANQLPVALANETGPLFGATFNDISAANMLTPGGGLIRLYENSPVFAPRVLAGLAANGLTQGDANLESYFNVAQAALDSFDPVNFADNLNETLSANPSFLYLLSEVEGDTFIPNAADEDLWGIAPLSGTFNTEGPNGTTIPVTVDSFSAPLAGSRPLSRTFDEGVDSTFFFTYLQAEHAPEDGEGSLSHLTPITAAPASAFGDMVFRTDTLFNPAP
ncbi:hypothetical protein QVZ43_13350 [Marinobacter sp. chi1]|uniref:Bacterial virulence factor lipase N-terminal domain-containing protein n=1 Tax=Marinobacter suaedae TaxID=3057675 RepID=A0ABT8W3A9_9GAMM|nr:hypothetical protein [Marinobacter sp. chi1]MDO3722706.1 hypothetical protein [Marinobacter sp. chi1]